ncbi:endonuclease/exonuclease/phosphatase family protein [Nocardia sp. CA-107356]|uniref:endonuclease/exonuclease/phosphatase family protein n=1 Tax=Nocardia sp. CA-107356 TaxID=3239972 RepID=UPI003D89C3F6
MIRSEVVDLLAWIATLTGAVGVVLHFDPRWLYVLVPSSFHIAVLAASGAPYLMSFALVAGVAFIARRHWIGAGVAIVVFATAVWTQAPLYVGRTGGGDGPAVMAMQANLLFDGADPTSLVDEVRARNIAVLTVNELTPAAVEGLGRAGLDQLLPYRYLSPGKFATGTGIWSSYPLSDTVEYDGFVLNQISATASVPGVGPVTVYAFHPVPPIFGTRVWADELSRLHGILERSPSDRPAIAGGDFNATYDHSQYRAMLSGRFDDAVVQAGAGHLVTYPTDKWFTPLVGIDHFLVAEGRAVEVETVNLPGADHRALVAQIRLDRGRH